MHTPEEYARSIKDRIITEPILSNCLYSANSRLTNWREREREFQIRMGENHFLYDRYEFQDRCESQKSKYIHQEEVLLSILQPICIQKEFAGYLRQRVYENEDRYDYLRRTGSFVNENFYFDQSAGTEVWYGDLELRDQPQYRYYLLYAAGGREFHHMIGENDVDEWGLTVEEIGTLERVKFERKELLSPQFVTKVIDLIESGDYQYQSAG